MPRLFIAVWPPPAVVRALTDITREAAQKLRWTTPDHWHITLRYLGDVDEAAAEAVLDAADGRSTEVELGPAVERLGPDVVVVPASGLDDLAAAVRAEAPDLGAPPHAEGFRAHLTLARVKGGGPTSADGAAFSARFVVDDVALVRSDLHADGARYTTVARRALPS